MKPIITVCDDITLVTLPNVQSDIEIIAGIFDQIGSNGIDVDMISLSPVQSAITSLSFTVHDDDFLKMLSYMATLREKSIKPIVSSGNCKISIYDKSMENCPGVCAKFFKAVASVEADIRVITTSECQISILVTKSDFEDALSAIQKCIEE